MPDSSFGDRPIAAPIGGPPGSGQADIARLLASAEAALNAGRIDESAELCRRVLALDPRRVTALILLGNIATRTGRAPQGIKHLRQALEIEPHNLDALNGLAFLLRATGQVAEAISLCRRALELNSRDIGAYLNLGTCQLTEQRWDDAIETFKYALTLQPNLPVLLYNLGLAMQQQGRYEEAAEAFRRTIALGPNLRDPHLGLGQVLLAQGKKDEAVASFRRAAELGARSSSIDLEFGRLLADEGLVPEGEEQVRKAVARNPKAPSAHSALGDMLVRSGKFEDAVASYKRALAMEPNLLDAYVGLVQAQKVTEADRPLLDKASQLLNVPNLDPSARAAIHYMLGKAFNDLGEYEAALRSFDEANGLSQSLLKAVGQAFSQEEHIACVDLMIKTYTKEFFARHRALGSGSDVPILICGMFRSGTTLMEQIVSSHPKVGAGDELLYWGGKWRALLQDSADDALDPAKLNQLAEGYLALLRSVARDAERVTDKMPENYMRLGMIHLVFPKAKIIHCRRNAVDNSLSIYMNNIQRQYAHDRENIVFVYRQHERLMAHWREVLPADTLLTVDYEELVADRERVTREIVDFCGLEWDDAFLRHEENTREIRTISLWQARQPVYKTSVERWRRYEPWLGAFRKLLTGQEASASDGNTRG